MEQRSPFVEPSLRTKPDDLAIVLLSRDNYEPITLQHSKGAVDGYAEGATLNTRFGSYPHSTLLDIPWGSQIRASAVDTGSRGRKRKLAETAESAQTPTEDDEGQAESSAPTKKATVASSGFIHVLRPTPELWTSSLPHRTQVVYTPDYSYILHRIRARPGTRIIEAGAGSGSFTHASIRAVYNGYPNDPQIKKGAVFSFEFHEPRCVKMQEEIKQHALEDLVRVTHRDVYKNGFLVDGESPRATAIFLDLPAPWEALRHLSRHKLRKEGEAEDNEPDWVSALDPDKTVRICTFSPCIEQVKRTVTELRRSGWVDVDMVELSHKRLNVYRDRVGLDMPNEKGFSQSPVDVVEAVARLKEISDRTRNFHSTANPGGMEEGEANGDMDVDLSTPSSEKPALNGKGPSRSQSEDPKYWAQGRLVHRTESEIKSHTSYLVFAVLPRVWSEEQEAAVAAKWPCGQEKKMIGNIDKESRKQEKRQLLEERKIRKKQKKEENAAAEAAA